MASIISLGEFDEPDAYGFIVVLIGTSLTICIVYTMLAYERQYTLRREDIEKAKKEKKESKEELESWYLENDLNRDQERKRKAAAKGVSRKKKKET